MIRPYHIRLCVAIHGDDRFFRDAFLNVVVNVRFCLTENSKKGCILGTAGTILVFCAPPGEHLEHHLLFFFHKYFQKNKVFFIDS